MSGAILWTKTKTFLLYTLLILVAMLMIGPFIWLLSTSFKTPENIYAFPPQLIPRPATLLNYVGVAKTVPIFRFFFNTVKITALGVGFNLLFCAMAAYPLAKFRFPGRDVIFGALVATMVVPNGAALIVNFMTIKTLGLQNSYLGVVLPTAATVFNIFLLRQAYGGVPNEFSEAARIDGANDFWIWVKVMLPLIRPALVTVVIFDFMAYWNSYLWPVIVLNKPDDYPLAAGLMYLQGEFSANFLYLAAGAVVAVTPMILIFLALQKYFMNGMVGALKG